MKYTFQVHFAIKKETGEVVHKAFSFKANSFYEAAKKGADIAKKHGDTFFIKKLTRIS
ncbi:hypothetical protein [Idiomarina sp.]|uniref:hypothetical protein n=1 Tax=Idiomarina sp. TaxID=1874361 RepID=UPI0025B7A7F9|nr:hypothetical protein [Idiomarina sp.]|tara:strand:+ start:2044 stop:2217 length:174 start_codon:yes stop_codon:yes gene_type:complete